VVDSAPKGNETDARAAIDSAHAAFQAWSDTAAEARAQLIVKGIDAVKKELSDSEVLAVLAKEAKKRAEAAGAFAGAGRPEQAAAERAEEAVLTAYLPAQLSDAELAEAVAGALAGGDFSGPGAMGPAMKAARAAVGDRADGARVSAEVRKQLGL